MRGTGKKDGIVVGTTLLSSLTEISMKLEAIEKLALTLEASIPDIWGLLSSREKKFLIYNLFDLESSLENSKEYTANFRHTLTTGLMLAKDARAKKSGRK